MSDRKFGVSSAGSSLIDHYEPHIVTAQDYYPFGMISRVELPSNNKSYTFGFNGKMNDNEVKGGVGNQQDYGLRIYDPRVGRFLSVDPLVESFPWYTPYQSTGNNPINYIDLDGAEPPPTTSQATPRVTLPTLGTWSVDKNGEFVNPTRLLTNEPINSGAYAPQSIFITQKELEDKICPGCGASINPGGKSMTIWDRNGRSVQVSLLKPVTPKREITWVDRLVAGIQIERWNQFNIKKQWNESIRIFEQITTDPSQLDNDYLDKVNRRLLNGTATDQDKLYANEVAARKAAGLLDEPTMIDFIQGSRDKATKKITDLPEGYKKTKIKSHGQAVYSNGKYWITPDQDGHNGGVWKMYDSERKVGGGKGDRMGTYDANLNRIGD